MKMLTEAEYAKLRTAYEMLNGGMEAIPTRVLVEHMLDVLRCRGEVLTVDLVPLQPLAQGHYRMEYAIRPNRRDPAGHYARKELGMLQAGREATWKPSDGYIDAAGKPCHLETTPEAPGP